MSYYSESESVDFRLYMKRITPHGVVVNGYGRMIGVLPRTHTPATFRARSLLLFRWRNWAERIKKGGPFV